MEDYPARYRMPKNVYPKLTMEHQWAGNEDFWWMKEWDGSDLLGGTTVVQYETELGVCHVGKAYCSPKDSYAKKNGKSLALGRLLRMLPKDIRVSVAREFVDLFGKVNEQYVFAGLNGKSIREVEEIAKRKAIVARAQLPLKDRPTPLLDRVAKQRMTRQRAARRRRQ